MGKAVAGSSRVPPPTTIVLFLVISSQDPPTAPEEDKVRMCRDSHSPRQKEDGHSAVKIIQEGDTCRPHVCYLANLVSRVSPYEGTHPVKLLTADNKARGHTAKFFICVYPHGKAAKLISHRQHYEPPLFLFSSHFLLLYT